MIGEVENRGSLGKLEEVALGSEHEDLILVEVHLKLVHHLKVVAILEYSPDVVEPLVESSLAFHTLISPVGSHAALGQLVHPFGADLHLYPFLLRSEHGDVQTLISVGLWHREPVAQSFRVRLIHVGDDGIDLPALHLLLLERRVEDDAYGKEVVDALKATLLLLHLLPDA